MASTYSRVKYKCPFDIAIGLSSSRWTDYMAVPVDEIVTEIGQYLYNTDYERRRQTDRCSYGICPRRYLITLLRAVAAVKLPPPPLAVDPVLANRLTTPLSETRLPIIEEINSSFDPKTTGPETTSLLQLWASV